MFKYKFLSIIMSLVLLFSFSGCSKTEEAYIYFELPEVPSTLDPQTAKTDTELLIIKNIYEGLLRKDQNGKITFGVAEDYIKTGLTYNFIIRDDAKWNNGDSITAADFVFAFRRAVDPKTKADYASRLFAIKNAKSINKGTTNVEKLGVIAKDSKTLQITLEKEDNLFLENLTTSVAMPCNEKFFNECAGKYGLFKDNITGNGSYRLAKWNKESFGIRLYKNEGYNGDFIAKNAAVFLTCNDDKSVTTKLKENDIDIAFIDSAYSDEMKNAGFKTANCQNICWFMTLSNDFSYNMRTALIKLVGKTVYENNLKSGYISAKSIFPNILNNKIIKNGITEYDLSSGKALYHNEVKLLENNKFPSNITLYFYDNGFIKPVVTDIVGHWQKNLSAFVNIESVSSPELLYKELENQTLPLAVFPVKANSKNLNEYLENFGYNYNGENFEKVQSKILDSKNIIPIVFQNTTLCFSSQISEIYTVDGDGFLDFSFIIKEEN